MKCIGRKEVFFVVFGKFEDNPKFIKACGTDATILNSFSNEWAILKWTKFYLHNKDMTNLCINLHNMALRKSQALAYAGFML